MMISILQTYTVCLSDSADGQKTFQRCHSDVHRIDTIILSDINVIETPPFPQQYIPVCTVLFGTIAAVAK
jgi:hypothetical protein